MVNLLQRVSKMEYLLSKLKYYKDEEKSLLGVHLSLMRYAGIYKSEEVKNKIIAMFMLITMSVITILSYIDLCFSWGNWTDMMKNLTVTLSISMNVLKVVVFRWNYAKWADIFENISSFEQKFNDISNKEVCQIVSKNSYMMRKITIGFMSNCSLTMVFAMIGIIVSRYVSRDTRIFFSLWLPFDQKTFFGNLSAFCLQIFGLCVCCMQSSVYDTTIFSIMIWFSTQFDVLHIMCKEMGKPISLDSEEHLVPESVALRRLEQCQRLHVTLLGLCRKVNALQSPVMFVNLCLCSTKLGATIVDLVSEQNRIVQLIMKVIFLAISLTEQFILYWFCNKVSLKSTEAAMGVWESQWYKYGVRVRRSCLILMMGLQNIQVIFTAGPCNKMTLDSFVSIMKTTYTAYTMLIRMNNTNELII